LYFDGTWDPLDVPAVTLKDLGHLDSTLNNLREFMAKVKEHSENATVINDLLISTVIFSKQNLQSLQFSF
jgi:hypothetical protein